MSDLPRLIERPHGSRLVTRAEAAAMLGYSVSSLATLMSRHPQRWPRPAAMLRRGRVWALLWDADELLAIAPPASATVRTGSVATISDTDGLLTCLECGRRFRSLGRHLKVIHNLTSAEYRDQHGLPATGALTCDGLRQSSSELQRRRLEEDPTALDHLKPYQKPEYLDRMREAAIEVHRDTMSRDLVREHRIPGQRYAVQVMLARRLERLDQIARDAGFDSLEAAIRETAGMSAKDAARRIGIGASTVRRRRAQP
ncbi:MAG TPA: MucR family transcriptional regulator [Candidatus Dormibacteraeota bacterium]|jgi:hypothetical protein